MDGKGLWGLLAEAQAEMPAPKKDKEGQVGPRRYRYASLDACLDSVRPALNRRGIFLSQKSVDEGDRLYMETWVMTDTEQVCLDREPYEYDEVPQEYGKRETYAKRYGLCKAFGIVGDEDTDGDVQRAAASARGAQAGKPAAQPDAQSMHRNLVAQVIELKKRCIGAGVDEEALDEWWAAKFGEGVTPNRLADGDLREAVDHLAAVEADMESIKGGQR